MNRKEENKVYLDGLDVTRIKAVLQDNRKVTTGRQECKLIFKNYKGIKQVQFYLRGGTRYTFKLEPADDHEEVYFKKYNVVR